MADIIVNTSPLQYLHQTGQLNLFQKLFGRIIVPGAVVAELAAGRRLGVPLPEPEALEQAGSWIVLDDKLARQAAVHLKLPLLGTAGILLRAKQAGHVHLIQPVLNQLFDLGFRLTPATARNILDLAGE